MQKKRIPFLFSSILIWVFFSCEEASESKLQTNSIVNDSTYFIGSQTCKSCHLAEYTDWTKSDHFLAMQIANDSSVLGDFNNAHLKADGVKTTFLKDQDRFHFESEELDGTHHHYQIKYTFGFSPLQQYLVETSNGQLQATRASWNNIDKKWFHQYAGQKIQPNDWLHWTQNSQNWNTMCASCHSTNFKKNYDFESDSYKSSYSEINVACESCHGAGSKHQDYINSQAYKNGTKVESHYLTYGKSSNNKLQLKSCAPCHARKTDITQTSASNAELLDEMIPEIISTEHYFGDGQINDEDYEYGSFVQSKMFHNKVKCSDCHNPHSGKLKKTGNDLCLSCHKPNYDSESHHFHKANTSGSQCVSCHMDTKTYMGVDIRRDHSFRIPRPDQSAIYKTPNACNSCHADQSSQWAAAKIKSWYGNNRAYHFSDDLLPGSLLDQQNQVHLIKLIGDTSQPAIARATAVFYLGQIINESSANTLLNHLRDLEPLVRYQIYRSLENFPSEIWINTATIGLSDKVRAVRIAAADLYHFIGEENVPARAKSIYHQANMENKNYLKYNRDFAIGNIMMADYFVQEKDYQNAIKHYLRGLQKDSMMNYARFNLSATYNTLGKNEEALNVLLTAAKTDPTNDRTFYNLGLLYYEMHQIENALSSFKKAYDLNSGITNLYYNYGLILHQIGKSNEAEFVLLKGLNLSPTAPNINYALAIIYIKLKDLNKAKSFVEKLYGLDPMNPEYQSLFKQAGLIPT